jgi:LPS-assembly lipoprotein
MSSPDRSRAPLLVALAALLALAGCQVRPLYSTTAGEPGPQADFPAIAVEDAVGRVEQVYRNALLFQLRGGGEAAETRYKLVFRMTMRQQELSVERGTGTPNLYQLTGGVSFLLKDFTTDESIFGASVSSTDSYTRSSQSYANVRASRDAENRLATQLAELTRARLAAYFATH